MTINLPSKLDGRKPHCWYRTNVHVDIVCYSATDGFSKGEKWRSDAAAAAAM